MEENALKGLCMVLLFVDTLLFGWPPYLLVRRVNQTARSIQIRTTIISYLSCFAGGVFLGACLLHLLAEGREVMEEYFEMAEITYIQFPVYEAVVAGGFFAIAIVEQIAHNLLHNSQHNHPHTHDKSEKLPPSVPTGRQDSGSFHLERRTHPQADPVVGVDNIAYYDAVTQYDYRTGQLANLEKSEVKSYENEHSVSVAGSMNTDDVYRTSLNNTSDNGKVTEATTVIDSRIDRRLSSIHSGHSPIGIISPDSVHDHDDEVVEMIQIMEVNPLRAFLLLGALSFHTIFDGLAVGLQKGTTDIWEMFTAICIHKSLVAICLGLQLFLAFKSRPIMGFVWVFVFSLISPIGVGIGMILSSRHIDDVTETLVNWILQGMATGTFLYVTVFEILQDEFIKKGGILKVFVTMLGFVGMAVAKYFDQD